MSDRNRDEDWNLALRDWRYAGLGVGRSAPTRVMTRAERHAYVQHLAAFPTFEICTSDDLNEIVRSSSPFAFPARWPIVHQATPADACYVILSGSAQVLRDNEVVATVGSGDLIGEMALMTGSLRRATVTTATRVTGLVIDNAALVALFARRPALHEAVRGVYRARTARPFPTVVRPASAF